MSEGQVGLIQERHRHRHEVNNEFIEQLEKAGAVVSGTSPDGKLVGAIELKGHPIFVEFVKKALEN